MGRRKNIAMLRLHLKQNWLQVLGGTETPQIDERVRHQLHAVVPTLQVLKSQQQPFKLVFPCERSLHSVP
jgi:hypothetical protein